MLVILDVVLEKCYSMKIVENCSTRILGKLLSYSSVRKLLILGIVVILEIITILNS